MSLLEQYEQQYATLIADITAQIGRLQTRSGVSEQQRDYCLDIDSNLGEARELLEQMGLELYDLNSVQRTSFTNKLNCAQVELNRLQNDFRNAKDTTQKGPHTSLGMQEDIGVGDGIDPYFEDVVINNDQRQHLLENSERIERTGNRLTEGYRVALETEALGTQVLNDLNHQRETIYSARSRLRETNADLGRASRSLNSMLLRALREKAVLYGVGICFVLLVGVSLYLTLSSSTP